MTKSGEITSTRLKNQFKIQLKKSCDKKSKIFANLIRVLEKSQSLKNTYFTTKSLNHLF